MADQKISDLTELTSIPAADDEFEIRDVSEDPADENKRIMAKRLIPTIVRKTGDETVNNSSTLQDDDHLFFSIGASEVWFVEGILICQGVSTTADFKFGWTGPAGATARWGFVGRPSDDAKNNFLVQAGVANSPNAISAIGTALACGAANVINVNTLAGFFTAAGTAGTIQLQWAQNTPTVENNKVLADSFLRATLLA